MTRIKNFIKESEWDIDTTIRAIRNACELLESKKIDPNWREKIDNPLPEAGNTCGPTVNLAYLLWYDIKEWLE